MKKLNQNLIKILIICFFLQTTMTACSKEKETALPEDNKNLVMVSRDYAQWIIEAGIPIFNDTIPSEILLLINEEQRKSLEKNQIKNQVIRKNFGPNQNMWFLVIENGCSPCLKRIIGYYAEFIVWSFNSDDNSCNYVLIIAEKYNIQKILNNVNDENDSGEANAALTAYNLGYEKYILRSSYEE